MGAGIGSGSENSVVWALTIQGVNITPIGGGPATGRSRRSRAGTSRRRAVLESVPRLSSRDFGDRGRKHHSSRQMRSDIVVIGSPGKKHTNGRLLSVDVKNDEVFVKDLSVYGSESKNNARRHEQGSLCGGS